MSSFSTSSLRALLVVWIAAAAWVARGYHDVGGWVEIGERGGLVTAESLRAGSTRVPAETPEGENRRIAEDRSLRPRPAVLLQTRVDGKIFRVERFAVFPARIDINRAPLSVLAELSGVGPSIAGRIIEYRVLHGPFRSVDELLLVPGIGPKTLARIRKRVRT